MDRQTLVTEVGDYFRDSDHWRRLVAHLQEPDPQSAHVHAYVHTPIHPDSLEEILRRYFSLRGWPLVRPINRLRPRPGVLDLHGIEPEGKVHFELLWVYREGVGIRPADGVESGSNLLLWNRAYIENFYGSFPFRPVGPREEEALSLYFVSEHWRKGLEIAEAAQRTAHAHQRRDERPSRRNRPARDGGLADEGVEGRLSLPQCLSAARQVHREDSVHGERAAESVRHRLEVQSRHDHQTNGPHLDVPGSHRLRRHDVGAV